jgi:hypothetical protein
MPAHGFAQTSITMLSKFETHKYVLVLTGLSSPKTGLYVVNAGHDTEGAQTNARKKSG